MGICLTIVTATYSAKYGKLSMCEKQPLIQGITTRVTVLPHRLIRPAVINPKSVVRTFNKQFYPEKRRKNSKYKSKTFFSKDPIRNKV